MSGASRCEDPIATRKSSFLRYGMRAPDTRHACEIEGDTRPKPTRPFRQYVELVALFAMELLEGERLTYFTEHYLDPSHRASYSQQIVRP